MDGNDRSDGLAAVEPMRGDGPVHPILARLGGSDRRSIGDADRVAEEIAEDSNLFRIVLEGMLDDDPVIRMRAADAVEKATRSNPELLRPHKVRLLCDVAAIRQQEVRWHLAQLLPRLLLDEEEREEAWSLLESFLEDESKIVQVNAMQAMADLTAGDESKRPRAVRLIRRHMEGGSPAVQSRGKRLLVELGAERSH